MTTDLPQSNEPCIRRFIIVSEYDVPVRASPSTCPERAYGEPKRRHLPHSLLLIYPWYTVGFLSQPGSLLQADASQRGPRRTDMLVLVPRLRRSGPA